MFKQLATRFDLHHGHAEPPPEVWVKTAVEALKRLGPTDGRNALEKLAESADDGTSRRAKEALATFTAPG